MRPARALGSVVLSMSAALFVVTVASVSSIQAQVDARFAMPERALETYIDALRRGDVLTVTECFNPASSFYLPWAIPIESYRVVRRSVFDSARVKDWNSDGRPVKAREGDVELQVHQTIAGKAEMYSYWLRLREDGWRIYSHSAWNGDL